MFQHFYINKKSKGIAILTKIEPLNIRRFHSDLCSIIKASYPNFDIVNVYRFSENQTKEKIEQFTIQLADFIDGEKNQVILGDMNLDILKSDYDMM